MSRNINNKSNTKLVADGNSFKLAVSSFYKTI